MADNTTEPEKVRREWVVTGSFDADAARVIANALQRDGMEAEADQWRDSADKVERWNIEDGNSPAPVADPGGDTEGGQA